MTLNIYGSGQESVPFGNFDSPIDNTTGVAVSIPVTGWALDNIAIDSIKIYKDSVSLQASNRMYISNAILV